LTNFVVNAILYFNRLLARGRHQSLALKADN